MRRARRLATPTTPECYPGQPGGKTVNDIAAAMAKLAGIRRAVRIILEKPTTFPEGAIYDPEEVTEYFLAYDRAAASLRTGLPEIFADLPYRGTPESSRTTDFNGRGFVGRQPLERLLRDIN